MTGPDNRESMLFVQNACQYYATARFAMHVQCMPLIPNSPDEAAILSAVTTIEG